MIQVLIAGALGLAGTVAFLGYSGHLSGKHSTSSSIKPAQRATTTGAYRPASSSDAEDLRSGLSAQERQQLREQLRGHWQSAHPGMRLVGAEAATPTAAGPGPESRRSR
ncbi:MAG: hypothetical protein R3E68_17770 [Burkholderiaceae bacterium]